VSAVIFYKRQSLLDYFSLGSKTSKQTAQ
jgi:hypothetical protein